MRVPVDNRTPRWAAVLAISVTVICGGCAYTPNYHKETGPSTIMSWDSPTAADVKARFASAERRQRDWPRTEVAAEDGAIIHWPLYFEDPFEDKGHGRTDQTHPHNVYHRGWEDGIALPYCLARFTVNWLLLPVSAIVTPPWTPIESDGRLSRQLAGMDHDAAPLVPWPGCSVPHGDTTDATEQPGEAIDEPVESKDAVLAAR